MMYENKKIFGNLIAALLLIILSEATVALYFSKNLDAKEFSALINELPEGSISERQLKQVTLESQELPSKPLENLHFKTCKWDSVDAHEKTFKNVIFEDCEFTNVNMSDAILVNVQFLKSKLHNVVMNKATLKQVKFRKSKLSSTDSNIDNGYNGIQGDEILFEECDLKNIGFYRGKGVFRFKKSTLYDVAGQSLSEGSALYFHHTQASLINFDRSKLTTLEILGSTIDKQSKIGGGSIKNIRVVDSKLELSLGENSHIESAEFENSGDVVIGGGWDIKNISIKNCPKDTYVINAGIDGFETLKIEACEVVALRITDAIGKYVYLKNVSTYSMDLADSKIETLVIDDLKIYSEIDYSDTQVNNFEQKRLSFSKNIEVYPEGSNIEIKPDKILED